MPGKAGSESSGGGRARGGAAPSKGQFGRGQEKGTFFPWLPVPLFTFFCDLRGVNFFSGQRQRTFSVYSPPSYT